MSPFINLNSRSHRGARPLAAVLLVGAALPSWATAQTMNSVTAVATASAAAPEVQEVVVTAEKRAGNITTTPIAVQVLSAEKLANAAVTNIYDIANMTPGLRMDLLGTNLQPTIRGVTSNTSGTGNSPNVAIYVDGYYQPSNLSNNLELADIKEIEVVKGPQGTLFGRNATGGAILVSTLAPSFTPSGKIEAGYGKDNDVRLTAYVTGPITANLAGSASVIYRDYDGFTKNIFTGHKDGLLKSVLGRVKLLYKPTDDLSITATLRSSNTHDGQGRVYRIDLPVGAATQGFFIPGTVVATKKFTNSQDLQPMSTTRVVDGGITTVYDMHFATLTSYSGFQNEKTYQQTDLDGTSTKLANITTRTNTEILSQEFNINSNSSGPLKWTVGANFYYNLDRVPANYTATNASPNPPSSRNAKILTKAYAVFADVTWEFVPTWFLTAGARESSEHKIFKFNNLTTQIVDTAHTWDSFTPRVNLRHEFDRNTSVYASFSKGFKAGTYNASTAVAAPINPERITAYEVGFKMSRPGLIWNNSAYHYVYRDMQVSSYDFTVAVPVTKLQNVGKATIYGIDTDLTWILTDKFDVNFDAAYTHGRYNKFPGATAYFPNANGIAYRSVPVDNSGKQMVRTPDFTGSVTLNYTQPVNFGTLRGSVHNYYTSSLYTEVGEQFKIHGYDLTDLTVSWTSLNGKWKVTGLIKNAFNKYYISCWDPVGSAIMVNDGAPRFYRASLSYAF
jgi:iron complex outermembrane receptor protein